MSDQTRDLIQRLTDALERLDDHYFDHLFDLLDEARAYLENTKPREQISEEENDRRFKECMNMINNLKLGEIEALMGPEFMEEFRRVAQRGH
jgi:hypothetical protein